ncbi:MAG: hypothetical protein J1E85_10300 [Ruminococcus sp.]|nr:hypothetical protein [Ruminococcus sp.]
MKKFELLAESKISLLGRTLYRIKALISFTTATGDKVNAGDLGGYIEKESNLSHDGDAWVYDNARVYGNAWVCGDARVYGNARVCGNAWVCDNARVCGNAWVYGNAWVCGDARVYGNARVCGNAWVCETTHILTIGAIGSRNDITTFYRNKTNGISVKCGCFNGTIDDFADKVEKTHGDSKHAKVYKLAIELAKTQIDLSCD